MAIYIREMVGAMEQVELYLGDILKLNSKDWVTDWESGVRERQGLRPVLLIFQHEITCGSCSDVDSDSGGPGRTGDSARFTSSQVMQVPLVRESEGRGLNSFTL